VEAAGPLEGLATLSVSPASADVIAGDGATSATFTAKGTFADGTSRDVTKLVTWEGAPSTLLVASGTLVSPAGTQLGGDGTMIAHGGAIDASAVVHVKLVKSLVVNGAPSSAPQTFAGAVDDGTLAPTVAYPLDGALFPPNLSAADVQWKPAAGTSLFEVAFSAPSLDVRFYTTCTSIGATGACSLVPDGPTWGAIVATMKGGDPLTLTVRGVGSAPGKAGTAKLAMQFASTAVEGGLYYFNTKSVTAQDGGTANPGIYRFDFDKQQHEPFFTAGVCAGCHALSKDGTKLLAPICTTERACQRPLQLAVVDVATKTVVTPPMPVGDSDTQTWTPDNKYYVTTPACSAYDGAAPHACTTLAGGVMNLVDAATNTLVGAVPVAPGALFPSFANDGKKMVFARGAPYTAPLDVGKSSLFTVDFNAPKWGTETALLTSSGENNYYPSFSPDDQWVIFSRSRCAPGDPDGDCDSYDDPGARVTVVPAAGGAAIDLASANGTGKLDNSWPKWSPFKGAYEGGDVFWVTFSTMRDYGYRTYAANGQPTRVRQLWLAGFDIAKAKAGKDPSLAPVWLPFQEYGTSNHIGQWTEKVVTGPK